MDISEEHSVQKTIVISVHEVVEAMFQSTIALQWERIRAYLHFLIATLLHILM